MPGITLSADTAVVVDPREPPALRRAAADLASDISKVFAPGKDAARAKIRVALETAADRPRGAEVFQIRAAAGEVLLTGSDLRGAIYAVYHFSQTSLGVDPLSVWTGQRPARRQALSLPENLHITGGPPAFRYRGWLINGVPKDWDRVFELLLRFKGNMIAPGIFASGDAPEVRAAADRGLLIAQSHSGVVGFDPRRWPEGVPYSYTHHPGLLVEAWQRAIDLYRPQDEVLWSVGYRGLADRPFWADDPHAVATDAERARMIRDVINMQIECVRRDRPRARFFYNAFGEGAGFVRSGLLNLPEGVTLVWPGDRSGMLLDGGAIARGQGVYYEATATTPPGRLDRELGRAARAGATEYLLLDAGHLGSSLAQARIAMETGWRAGRNL